jgi:hypothetical protein
MSLTDDQLRAIGRISVGFNTLELATYLVVGKLMNRDLEIGRRMLAGERLVRMLDKAKMLSQYVTRDDPALQTRMNAWVDSANDVRRRRNLAFHSIWSEDDETGEVVAMSIRGEEPRPVSIRPTDLDQLADEINAVWVEGAHLIGAITDLYR